MIAAQRIGAGPGRGDEVLHDGGRNVVAVQRGVERRGVAARLREKQVALQHGVVERCVGVDGRLVNLVKLLIRDSPIGLVAVRRQDGAVLAVRERDLDALREPHRRILHVGRRERGIGVVRRRGEAAREREEVFALVVEHVLLLPVEILESETVHRQRRAGVHPLANGRQRNLQQFGIEPRRGLRGLCEQNLHLLPLGVDLIVTLILVVPERRVVPDLVLELADLVASASALSAVDRCPAPASPASAANAAICRSRSS